MRSRPPTRPTYEELLARVRDLSTGYRGHILDGVMYVDDPPSVARAHTLAEISATLMAGSALGDPAPNGWSVLTNAELKYGMEGLLVADIAGWRCDKQKLAEAASPIQVVPSWIGEVVGGAARSFTLTGKRRAYAEMGVEILWIADPEARVLEVFQNLRGKWLLELTISEEANITVPPFEDIHFDANDLWLPSPPPRSSRSERPHSSRRLSTRGNGD